MLQASQYWTLHLLSCAKLSFVKNLPVNVYPPHLQKKNVESPPGNFIESLSTERCELVLSLEVKVIKIKVVILQYF